MYSKITTHTFHPYGQPHSTRSGIITLIWKNEKKKKRTAHTNRYERDWFDCAKQTRTNRRPPDADAQHEGHSQDQRTNALIQSVILSSSTRRSRDREKNRGGGCRRTLLRLRIASISRGAPRSTRTRIRSRDQRHANTRHHSGFYNCGCGSECVGLRWIFYSVCPRVRYAAAC